MSFRDEAEQEEHFQRNRHHLEKEALCKATMGNPKRSGVYWKGPHEPAPDPCKPPEGS